MENAAKLALETRILMDMNGWAGHYPALDGAARLLAVYGVLPLVAAVVYLAICSPQGWRRWGGVITLASVVAAVFAVRWVDRFLARPSPFLCHPVRLLLCVRDGVSLPSLEMGAAAALAFGVFAYGGWLRWLSLPYLILMASARVFCGIEYPLDQVWACTLGCTAALVAIAALNPRHIFVKPEGWPVGAVGTLVVLPLIVLFFGMPETSLPPQPSTFRSATRIVGAEEKSTMKGMSSAASRPIANALAKLHLPGRIRRVKIGEGEFTSIAAVKFDAGNDANPMPRAVIEREALAIIRTTFAVAPKVSEVDVFAVTTWDRDGTEVLSVVYSASARRKQAGFLFTKSAAKLAPSRAMSRFGLTFYRVRRGSE